jgi:hypothetical protein
LHNYDLWLGTDADYDFIEVPKELPEDPISQLSLSIEESRYKKNVKESSRRINITLGQGKIDTSKFRMPKVQPGAQSQRISSHSDGFNGHEADPIGIFMPLRKQTRRQPTWQKITVRMGELTLVAERPSEEDVPENQARPPKKTTRKPRNRSEQGNSSERCTFRAPAEGAEEGDEPMLVDHVEQLIGKETVIPIAQEGAATATGLGQASHGALEQPVGKEELLHRAQGKVVATGREQTTPQISDNENTVLKPCSRSSPLQQKEQRNRKVAFEDETNIEPSQAASTQPSAPFGRRESNEVGVSLQLNIGSASRMVVKPRKKEIDVPLQVSVLISLSEYCGPTQEFARLSNFPLTA